jgi:hypothetical protein
MSAVQAFCTEFQGTVLAFIGERYRGKTLFPAVRVHKGSAVFSGKQKAFWEEGHWKKWVGDGSCDLLELEHKEDDSVLFGELYVFLFFHVSFVYC